MKELKNEKAVLKELLEHYEENIETYNVVIEKTGKKQQHRKLKDNNYEKELNEATIRTFRQNEGINDKVNVKLKLGFPYNRTKEPWIQLYYMEKNAKGTNGRYTGISLDIETQMVEMWIGFGMTKMKKQQLLQTKEQYIEEYHKMFGNQLERGFQYESVFVDATIISKSISIDELDNEEFRKDIAYLTDLYVSVESRENIIKKIKDEKLIKKEQNKQKFKKSNKLMGKNILYKGFPGSGKSYMITQKYLTDKNKELINENQYERVTFYSEYTNAEFVGTIRPCVKNQILKYDFIAGPFTTLLEKAINNEQTNFYLIIEEINRGDAGAIFGDIFQLLDREDGNGRSVYSITNQLIAGYIYKDETKKIYLPKNFSIIATMNVSDENVKTLDNAFERRWENIWVLDKQGIYDQKYIQGMEQITWGKFRQVINKVITSQQGILKNEDKQLGAYFIDKTYVTDNKENNDKDRRNFLYKVIINLYTKICKYDKTLIFDEKITSINELATTFLSKDYMKVFKEEIKEELLK